jgi:hypothetical protein
VKAGKVYIITNDPVRCGVNIALDQFEESILAAIHQKNTARTSADGLWLGCIMLDPKYRDSVSGIMSKKKNRMKSDIPGDHVTNFFETILTECFSNPSYEAVPPPQEYYSQFPEEERETWNPNSASVFEHERSGEWLRDTWENYLRPKYKKALDRWNKQTGGGDGTPVSFIDYCAGDRWLVYLFCKDHQANFLLAGNAGGRMPHHLQFEAGFDDQSSLTGTSPSNGTNSSKQSKATETLALAKRKADDIRSMLDTVRDYLSYKRSENTSTGDYLKKVADYSQMMKDDAVLETMSPESKAGQSTWIP